MPAHTTRIELRQLMRLALPLAIAQAGTQLMSVVDLAVLGRVGAKELGAAGLGNAIFFTVSVFGMGLVMGIDPMISQALGARDEVRARHVFWQGVWLAIATTIVLTLVLALVPFVLPYFGLGPDVRRLTSTFLVIRTAGLGPLLLFVVGRAYLQAHHVTRPLVIAMLAGNVFNFLADIVLVFGGRIMPSWSGPLRHLPPFGVAGAAISTDLGALLQLAILAYAVKSIPLPAHDEGDLHRWNRAETAQAFRVGLPLGSQMGAELAIFTFVGVLAGRFGALPLAAHQLVLSLAALTYSFALGVSSAASVRVGIPVGARDQERTRMAGFIAIATGMAWMSLCALVFAFAPRPVARVITDQPDVVAAAIPLLLVAAFFQIFDGVQVVAAGALRGAGDTKTSFLVNFFGYWIVGAPVALYLAYWRGMGVIGLWWGLCASLATVAILLTIRFERLSSREIKPIAGRTSS